MMSHARFLKLQLPGLLAEKGLNSKVLDRLDISRDDTTVYVKGPRGEFKIVCNDPPSPNIYYKDGVRVGTGSLADAIDAIAAWLKG
jgi:hypothetical protein